MTQSHKSECSAPTGQDAANQKTNDLNFATDGTPMKALMQPPFPTPKPKPDKDAIRSALKVLFDPADVVELRSLPSKGPKRTDSGYFDANHWDDLADNAVCLSESGDAVYTTLNPVVPQLLSRCSNRIQSYAKSTTTDKDVIRRRWLLTDLDPVRPSGTSATDAQLKAAENKASEIYRYLAGIGWPKPVTAMSGNGYHLLYAIDLPNDAASTALVKGVLLALADRFDDAHTKVDRSVFNAARICKLYGTVSNKGDHTVTAPWRQSYLIDTPERVVVTVGQLAMVQPPAQAAAPSTRPVTALHASAAGSFNLEEFLERHNMVYTVDQHDGRERFRLAACPFNPEHVNGEAAVFRKPSGELGFKCQHDSCSSYHWQDVRELFDGPQQGRMNPVAVNASNAMLTGQFVASNGALNASMLNEDMQRLHSALAAIPVTSYLKNHTAEQVIGMALRHKFSSIDEDLGRALCGDWDVLTGGAALTVFNASDPNY